MSTRKRVSGSMDSKYSHTNATAQGEPVSEQQQAVERRFKRRSLLKALVFAVSALGLLLVVRLTPLAQLLDPQWVDAHIKAFGHFGAAVFVLLAGVLTAVGAPRQLLAFLGGYAYGFFWGFLLSLLGMSLGCLLSFSYARLMGRGFVQRRLGRRLRRLDDVLSQSPLSTTLMLRFLPFTNNLVTNLAAGVSNVGLGWFLLGSALGYMPQTVLFALLGTGIKVGQVWQVVLSIALFAASLVLAYVMLRKHRRLYKVVESQD